MLPRVSDLRCGTKLARQPFLLLGLGVALSALSIFYGRWLAPQLDETVDSMALAMGAMALQVLLLLVAVYFLGMAVAVFALGGHWRDEKLLVYTPDNPADPNTYFERLGDKTLLYWTLTAATGVVVLLVLQAASGGYFLQFPIRGYDLVSLRSSNEIAQIRGLTELVHRDLDDRIAPDALRARLETLLQSDAEEVRAQAAWTTGRLQLASLDMRIRSLLDDPSPEVREQAAIAIGQLGVASSVASMLDRWDEEQEVQVQKATLVGLAMARKSELAPQLASLLPAMTDEIRPYALWALGESENLCISDFVMAYAAPTYPEETRCAAMEAMKKLSTTTHIDALNAVFHEDDLWCPLSVWQGRSSNRKTRDFYRMMVSGERIREKAMDATFNVADPSLRDWLTNIVNNEDYERLDRKHARRVYDYLNPAQPRQPRVALGCPTADERTQHHD